jgi:hypothetical protein
VGINQRVSLRNFTDDIHRWVEQDKSDEWIASALGTSPASVQSFRSRNAIYRRHATTSTLYDPKDYSSYEKVKFAENPKGELRHETVRKGGASVLRALVRAVYWGQNGPNNSASAP